MPTWKSIRATNINLNANAVSVPTNPGITPPPRNAYKLPVQQATRRWQWEDLARTYKLCIDVNTALCNQLTAAVDETYILSLKN
eukprot:105427-Ditylum_brightwellii.AAC.1